MKKLSLILIFLIQVNIISFASVSGWYESDLDFVPSGPTAPTPAREWIYEDFDSSGDRIELSPMSKTESGGYVSYTSEGADGYEMAIGVTARESTAACDPHVASPKFAGDDAVYISYDMTVKNIANGTYNSYIRNSANSKGITFLSISASGKATYLPKDNAFKKSITIADGERFNVAGLYIPKKNEFRVYHNGELMTSIANTGTVLDVEYQNGYIFRFHPFVTTDSAYEVAIDNICICKMTEYDGMYVGSCISRGKDSLVLPVVSEQSRTICPVTAVYQEDSLKYVELTEFRINQGQAIEALFACGDFPNSKFNTYLLESIDNLRPIGKKLSLHSNSVGISSSVYSGLVRGAEYLQNLYTSSSAGEHPRLLVTKDELNTIIENHKNSDKFRKFIARVDSSHMKRGIQSNGNDDGYFDYVVTDNRLLTISRRVKSALIDLSLAYRLTGDEKYFEKAWEILSKVNSYPDWHHSHLLDTSELASGVAVAYDWFYDKLSNSQREAIEQKLITCAIEIAENGYATHSGWTKEKVNRNIVNNGGFIMAALALADVLGPRAFEFIDNALEGIEYMLPSFAPDGAWEEGPAYTDYTLEYLVKTFSSLEASLGSELGLSDIRGMDRIVYYIFYTGGASQYYNFHDSAGGNNILFGEMLYLIRMFDDKTALKMYDMQWQYQNKSTSYADILWYDDFEGDFTPPPLDAYFRDVELVCMKDSVIPGETQTFLAFHGGRTDPERNHHHCDCGSFVLDLAGERWACDLGTEPLAYKNVGNNPAYTGTAADLYRKRAEGHNCLVINPDLTSGQIELSEAKVTEHYTTPEGAFAKLDMSGVYQGVDSVFRSYELCDNRTSAVITDEISLADESDVYWFMHTDAECTLDGNTVRMTKNGKTVYLKAECSSEFELSVEDAAPLSTSPQMEGQSDNSRYRKVQIYLKASDDVRIRVSISPDLR